IHSGLSSIQHVVVECDRRCFAIPRNHVTAEDGVLIALLEVHSADALPLVLNGSAADEQFPAWVVGLWKSRCDSDRGRTVKTRVDSIVGKRRSQRDQASSIAGRRCKGCPVA